MNDEVFPPLEEPTKRLLEALGEIQFGSFNEEDILVSCQGLLLLKELVLVLYYYPGDVDERKLAGLFFQVKLNLATIFNKYSKQDDIALTLIPDFEKEDAITELTVILTMLMMHGSVLHSNDGQIDHKWMNELMAKASAIEDSPFREIADQLVQIEFERCHRPHPANDPEFSEVGRDIQLLGFYWGIFGQIIIYHTKALVGFQPSPFLRIFVLLKKRIGAHLKHLSLVIDCDRIENYLNNYIDSMTGSEPDELSVVPEMAYADLNEVETMLYSARIENTRKTFELTYSEKQFEASVSGVLAEVQQRSDVAFKQMVRNVEKQSGMATSSPAHITLTTENLVELCRSGESQVVEFKRAGTDLKKIVKEIVGMANTKHGGRILYGVEDSGEITGSQQGLQDFDQPLQNSLKNTVKHGITVAIDQVLTSNGTVLVITVPPKPPKKFYMLNEKIPIRKGTNIFTAEPEEIIILANS